jgi:adenylate cyclase
LRLSPFDAWAYEGHVAFAMAALKEALYDEAASHFANAAQANPSFTSPRFLLAMTLALAARLDEAREVARKALELQPGFRSRFVFEIGLLPQFADEFAKGARLLGLPE